MISGLFLGEGGGNRLLLADQGSHDDGVVVVARVENVPAGPGIGGEAIFPALFLTITGTGKATIDIVPIISGADELGEPFEYELESQQITTDASLERVSRPKVIGLSLPLVVNGVEVARFSPRGTWFRARITAVVHDDGDLILEGQGVEMEVVRESLFAPAINPPRS
jgi:hypothetical protein